MQTTLFSGVADEWYKQRLKHMYQRKPRCKLLMSMNHLLGNCPTCGAGRFANSQRFQIVQLPIDRIYTILITDVAQLQHIQFVRQRWPGALTNAEYPIPLIEYKTFKHIPLFIDLATSTVIDFLTRNTTRTKHIVRVADKLLTPLNYRYVAFDGEDVIYKSTHVVADEQHRLRLADSLRHLTNGGKW